MASVWPPQGRDDEPGAVNVAPVQGQSLYPQVPQQTWGLPPPAQVPPEETKDYNGVAYNKPAYGGEAQQNWGRAPPQSRRSFKSDDDAPPKYQDVWAAGLFVAHLAVIFWLAFTAGVKVLRADATTEGNQDNVDVNVENNSIVLLSVGGALCTLVAAIMSFLAVRVMINHSRTIIQFMFVASVGLQGIAAVAAIFAGQVWLFVMCLVFAAITVCYYTMVRSRIPFAATNLAVACAALKKCPGPMAVAFGLTLVQMVWQFIWVLAMLGAVVPKGGYSIEYGDQQFATSECRSVLVAQNMYNCICQHEGEKPITIEGDCRASNPPAGLIFLMLLSFFWGSMVISNVVHCTVAGVVAEWFLNGSQTASSTWQSFKRATTTSFGSICFGSLLVAIVRTMHQMLQEMRKARNSTVVACAECLLSILSSVVEYFNRYAFVEVALYGKSFIESGRAAMNLFRSRGLSAVINDQLVSTVFTFGSLTTSVIVALFGYLFGVGFGINRDYLGLLVGLGFLLGLVVSSIIMNVVDSAVATVFVCWAEAGDALERTHRELYAEMLSAWAAVQAPGNRV